MATLRGTGMAAVNYPTGMNLGGDPSQALIHATTSGSFNVVLAAADLGQGLRTVMAQIAAETLGVPYDQIVVETADTDTGPHDMGTFASRATHRVGNAVKAGGHRGARRRPRSSRRRSWRSPWTTSCSTARAHRGRRVARPSGSAIADLASRAQFQYGRTIAGGAPG